MTNQIVRIDYITREESGENCVAYAHLSEPVVVTDGDKVDLDWKAMTATVVRKGRVRQDRREDGLER
jgi:hypothetical protein